MLVSEQVTEPYDWRLALPNLERRDGYFSRLRARIEVLTKTRGEKVHPTSAKQPQQSEHHYAHETET